MQDQREKDRFLSFLRERRQRVTAERLTLLDEVFRQHGHIDAEQLLAAVRQRGLKISRATVYRNLELLVESGLVRRQRLGRRRFLYEHVHGGQRHDHLVCTACGKATRTGARMLADGSKERYCKKCTAGIGRIAPAHAKKTARK